MFILPELPYPAGALAPTLSELLMRTHHDKHHRTYVDTVNKLVGEAGGSPDSMEAVVRQAAADGRRTLFNNAGQAWNHAFFWECMIPENTAPAGVLAQAIDRDFGGLAALKTRFVDEGATHFGSGWVWIVAEGGKLSVLSTHDADTPIARDGPIPVLVCDVWEHAYYLDHKQDRKGFLGQWFDRLANWRFAEAQLGGERYRYPPPR